MGIWLLCYGIEAADQPSYLEWFHSIHMPEKRAREDYEYAAHYLVDEQAGAAPVASQTVSPAGSSMSRYIALFCSQSSRTFFDPSPAELKPRQDELTRRMIGYRQAAVSVIATVDWSARQQQTDKPGYPVGEAMALHSFERPADEQLLGAWCAQDYMPAQIAVSGCNEIYKLITSAGQPRHWMMEDFTTIAAARSAFTRAADDGTGALAGERGTALTADDSYQLRVARRIHAC